MLEALRATLFPSTGGNTYAIVDGAACEDLLDRLAKDQPPYVCLYAGELTPDLAECAPYLVQLELDSPFTAWIVDEGWDKYWCIFATSPAELQTLRKHFRSFLRVKGPAGNTLYFRYYDPRVMRNYLPTCNREDLDIVFGPLTSYVTSSREPLSATCFTQHEDGRLSQHTLFSPKTKLPHHAENP